MQRAINITSTFYISIISKENSAQEGLGWTNKRYAGDFFKGWYLLWKKKKGWKTVIGYGKWTKRGSMLLED